MNSHNMNIFPPLYIKVIFMGTRAAVVVLTAAAVVLAAVAEDQCQPLVGSLLGSGGDDGSS
jgi:hypothetical protein